MNKPDIKKVMAYQKDLEDTRKEMAKSVVGQEHVINGLLRGLVANGHILVEGIPGIAKTLTVRTIAKVTGCDFSRVQFTVDLLPSDILGIRAYDEKKGNFYVLKGPIFSNFVLADEINRATPKTQAALLEAMQEKQVTIGTETFKMFNPFFVMATQNPIEQAGTYPLPEAQIDRFLFKILMYYPKEAEEEEILKTNITLRKFEDIPLNTILTQKRILEMQEFVKKIFLSKDIEKYIVKITNATRYPKQYKVESGKYIEWGGSPRMSIGLFIGSKTDAMMHGSNFVTPQNVKNVAHDVMRHRILLNYEGQAEGIKTDDIIDEILEKIPVP